MMQKIRSNTLLGLCGLFLAIPADAITRFYSIDVGVNPPNLVRVSTDPVDTGVVVIAQVTGLPVNIRTSPLDLGRDGFLYLGEENTIYKISTISGAVVDSLQLPIAGTIQGLAVADDGLVYVYAEQGRRFWSVDLENDTTDNFMSATSGDYDDMDFDSVGNLINFDLNESGNVYRIPLDGTQPVLLDTRMVNSTLVKTSFSAEDDAFYFVREGPQASVWRMDWQNGLPTTDANFVRVLGLGDFEGIATFATEEKCCPVVLAASFDNDEISAFDGSDGSFLRTQFTGTEGISFPNGMTSPGNGTLFASNVDTNSVIQFDVTTGAILRQFSGGGLNAPDGVLLNQQTIFVTSFGTDSVKEFNLETGLWIRDFVTSAAGGLDGPSGMTRRANGNLLVSSQRTDQILEFNGQTGAFVGIAGQGGGLDQPSGLLRLANDHILVASFATDSILEFLPNGALVGTFVSAGSGGLDGPFGLARSPDDTLLVTSRFTGQVLEYSLANGAFLGVFIDTGVPGPTGIAVVDFQEIDCNQNGILDRWDVEIAFDDDCNANLVPDGCEYQAWQPREELAASGAENNDEIGAAVAISGSWSAVGAPGDDDDGANAGAVFMYRSDGFAWVFEQKLSPNDPQNQARFGSAIAMDDDRMIVGAPTHGGNDSGAAYVFRLIGGVWVQEDKLLPMDLVALDEFGSAVGINNDTAIVGSPQDDDNGPQSGSAYIFERVGSDWIETDKLLPFDGAALDFFGTAVAVNANYAIGGSPGFDGFGGQAGAAYVFAFNGASWIDGPRLNASDASASDEFGSAIAMTDRFALIGAPADDDTGLDSGSAYVFQRVVNDWDEIDKLTPADGLAENSFGNSVAITGFRALVGAKNDQEFGSQSGAAYTFTFAGGDWTEEVKLLNPDDNAIAQFGAGVALDQVRGIVGAPAFNEGAAYSFQFGGDCDGNGVIDECDIADGAKDDNDNGILDSCEPRVADMNCDGAITVSDIGPFILALIEPADYIVQYPDCNLLFGDLNGDGFVTVSDIGLFVETLTG